VRRILVINGPNLNLLGTREKDIYGTETLESIAKRMYEEAEKLTMELDFIQSNHEGEIIDRIHEARGKYNVIIINAGAYSHYSTAIRDAIKAVKIPAIEVHLSNIYNREEFRSKSVIAPVCVGQISGFGGNSYIVALHAANMMEVN
jgi:3-dehydroquinate dehydratase-2